MLDLDCTRQHQLLTVSLLQELLQSETEHNPLHQLHVDEPWVLLLNVLQLLVSRVGHPLLVVR